DRRMGHRTADLLAYPASRTPRGRPLDDGDRDRRLFLWLRRSATRTARTSLEGKICLPSDLLDSVRTAIYYDISRLVRLSRAAGSVGKGRRMVGRGRRMVGRGRRMSCRRGCARLLTVVRGCDTTQMASVHVRFLGS